MSERAGLIALTLEGYMLGGAFGAAVGAYYSGSPIVGALFGMVIGTSLALLYAVSALRFRANQVVTGVAINLLVIGLTRFFLRLLFDSSSNSPRVPGFGRADTGSGFGALALNPLVYAGLLSLLLVGLVLMRTAFGLRVRAVGEHPEAAASVGVNVARTRYLAVAASGALAALGGVYLALDQHQFTDQMTAGRGFIALAATIFGRWEPKRVGRGDVPDPASGNAAPAVAVRGDDSVRADHRGAGGRRRARSSAGSTRTRRTGIASRLGGTWGSSSY
jgi:simple sugar transport system permease protein